VNRSFRLILGLIFAIIVVGLAAMSSGVLVLAIPLMVYLFAAIALRPEAVEITAMRVFTPDHTPQDKPVAVTLKLRNTGPAVAELAVQDVLPNGMSLFKGEVASTVFLSKDASLDLEYTITAQRGEYSGYEMVICARDVLGLFEETLVYRPAARLVVHPRYPKLGRIKIRPPQTHGFAGPIAARQGGCGIDFWCVREYQASDPQRQINWRLSTREEREYYTNVFEQERVADVGIILDARERLNVFTASGSLFEHSVRAAAALAENFLDDGNRVSLLIYGSGIVRVFPGYGRVHRNRILRELSKSNPGDNYALESLNHLPTRLFPARSQLVIVSPLMPNDVPTLTRMRAHGYALIVVSPDPVSYEAAQYDDCASPAYRIAYAERNLMLRQILQCGAQVVNWRVEQSLESAIRETLAGQPMIHHKGRS
jgi:uncharacterized protein (DUF58 family)